MSDAGLGSARGEIQLDVSQAIAGIQKLRTELSTLSRASIDVGRAGQTLNSGLADAASGIQKAQTATASFSQNLGTVAAGLGKLALPAVAAGAAAGVMAGQFDTALRNVNSIAHLSENALADLGQQFLDLSNDSSKTHESAVAMADGFYEIQSSGFAGADGMKVLEASTKAASAGMTNTAVAGKAIAATLNTYALSAEEAGRVSDVLFQTVNLGVVNFEELAGTIGRVLPSADALNVSIENVGAALSTLTKSGLSGSQAITNLNSLFNSIIKPTKEASDAAAELGLDFSAAALQSKGLTQFLQDMSAATGGNVDVMGKLIGSQEGLNAALSLTSGNAQGFISDLEQMNGAAGATQAAYAEMSKSTGAALQELRKSFENLAIVAGSQLTPLVRDAATAISDMTAAFQKLPANEQQKYIQIAGAVAGLVVGLFALTKAVQGTLAVVGALRAAYGLMTTATVAATGSTTALGAAMSGIVPIVGLLTAGLLAANALETEFARQGQATADAIDKRSVALKRATELQAELTARGSTADADVRQEEALTAAIAERAEIVERIQLLTGQNATYGVDPLGIRTRDLAALNTELAASESGIDALADAIDREQAANERNAAMTDYRAGEREVIEGVTAAHEDLTDALHLSAEAQEAYNKAITDNIEAGRSAVSDVVQGQIDGLRELAAAQADYQQQLADLQQERAGATTDDERAAIDERIATLSEGFAQEEAAQAESYARQQAAAQAHLGELLQEYVSQQEAIGKISSDQATELRQRIGDEFGVLPDIVGQSYDEMVSRISAGGSTDAIIADLQAAGDAAVTFQQRFDELLAQRTAEITVELHEGTLTPEQYAQRLQELPAEVTTQVTVETQAAEYQLAKTAQLAQEMETRNSPTITVDADTAAAIAGITNVGQAANALPKSTNVAVTSNAPEIAGQLRGVASAVNSIPSVKTVTVKANIDPQLQQHSPSPIERVIATIDDASKKPKTIKVNASGATEVNQVAGAVDNMLDAINKLKGYDEGSLYEDAIYGFTADTGRVIDAFSDMAGQFNSKGVEHAAAIAESGQRIFSLVASGVDAIAKLRDYDADALYEDAIFGFTHDAERVIDALSALASKYSVEGTEHAAKIAQSASTILSLTGAGITAIRDLVEYHGGRLRDRALIDFQVKTQRILTMLIELSAQFDQEGVAAAAAFSESASRVLALTSPGIDAIAALVDYGGGKLRDRQLIDFRIKLGRILVMLQELSAQFSQKDVAKAAEFSKAAQDTVGLIADGIDAINKLVTYQGGRNFQQPLYDLAYDLRVVITVLDDLAAEFQQDGVDAGAAFASAAGDVIGLISDGVDAFNALDEAKPVDMRAFDTLADNIEAVVREMVAMAQRIDKDLLPQTVEFAEATSKILEPIAKAVDTFTKVNDYVGISPEAFKLLANDMVGVVGHMVALTATLKQDGYAAAVEFSETAESIFGGLQSGLQFLTDLGDYEPGKATANFGVFRDDFLGALNMAARMAQDANAFLSESERWKDTLGDTAENFREGIDSLLTLDGLSVNLAASISATPNAPPPPPETASAAFLGRRITPQAASSGSVSVASVASGPVEYHEHFHMDGPVTVRDEDDISRIAQSVFQESRYHRRRGA